MQNKVYRTGSTASQRKGSGAPLLLCAFLLELMRLFMGKKTESQSLQKIYYTKVFGSLFYFFYSLSEIEFGNCKLSLKKIYSCALLLIWML